MSLCAFAPVRETLRHGLVAVLAFYSATAFAADDVAIDTVLTSLRGPCGIAVRPGGTADQFEVFIAETGAGRIVRWATSAPNDVTVVVAGFQAADDVDRFEPQGPVALWFLDPGLLVVGASNAAESRVLRSFELPEDGSVLDADMAHSPEAGTRRAEDVVCLSMTRTRANEFVPDSLVLALRAGSGGGIRKARIQAGTVGQPRSFGTGEQTSAPRAVATSPAGRIVVADGNGRLTFYNPIDGDVELQLSTELRQITDLAYSPTTSSLFAADFARGIFRIDDVSQPGRPACKAVRITAADQPSALAFAPDGALYVVTFGDGDDGALQVVTGDL